MAVFEAAYKIVAKHEGGYANDPDDAGAETYKGISRRYHPGWRGWAYVDFRKKTHGPVKTGDFIENEALDAEVKAFYKAWWDRLGAGAINSQPLANALFDFTVLSGRGVETMQKALNNLGANVGVDNKLGPATLSAVNKANPAKLAEAFVNERVGYHTGRVNAGAVSAKFLPGWIKRAKSFAAGLHNGGTATAWVIGAVLLAGIGLVLAMDKKGGGWQRT